MKTAKKDHLFDQFCKNLQKVISKTSTIGITESHHSPSSESLRLFFKVDTNTMVFDVIGIESFCKLLLYHQTKDQGLKLVKSKIISIKKNFQAPITKSITQGKRGIYISDKPKNTGAMSNKHRKKIKALLERVHNLQILKTGLRLQQNHFFEVLLVLR